MVTPLRGGIVGCGYFGQIQLEAWRRMPEARIVAACDLDLRRARAAAPAVYANVEEMLARERLDFLDVATRPDSHLPLVRLAARHGVPVICQKPMAPGWDEAVAMVESAEAAGVRLMIHENWRWQPWFREARRLIQEDAVGAPVSYRFEIRQRDGAGPHPYPNQPYFARMPRLLIYETLVHPIDTARFLFGDIATVYAQARKINPIIAGEDQAVLVTTHTGGLPGLIDGDRHSSAVPPGPAMGMSRIDGDRASLIIPASGDVFLDDRRVWTNTVAEGYKGDSVRATQQHFIHCLRTGEPFESEGRAYLKTFGAVEAAYESVRTSASVSTTRWQ